jgi:hypothetical protein
VLDDRLLFLRLWWRPGSHSFFSFFYPWCRLPALGLYINIQDVIHSNFPVFKRRCCPYPGFDLWQISRFAMHSHSRIQEEYISKIFMDGIWACFKPVRHRRYNSKVTVTFDLLCLVMVLVISLS